MPHLSHLRLRALATVPAGARACTWLLIAGALAACSSTDRLGDAQVRPMDRPECQVGSQRRDLDAGVPVLIGGTGCRGNPDAPQPLNRRPANAVELGKQND